MKNFWIALVKAVAYTLAFVLLQLAGSFVAVAAYCVAQYLPGLLSAGVLPGYDTIMRSATDFAVQNATALAGLGDLLAVFAAALFFRARGKRLSLETNLRVIPLARLWPAPLWGGCLSILVCIGISLLPIPEAMLQNYMDASEATLHTPGLVSFISVVLLAPVAEEIFFRGLVYTRLKRGMRPLLAALLASAFFALIHADPLWMLYAFCMALAMAFVFEKCGSLWASISFHVVFNFFGAYVQPLMENMPAGTFLPLLAVCVFLSIYLPRRFSTGR